MIPGHRAPLDKPGPGLQDSCAMHMSIKILKAIRLCIYTYEMTSRHTGHNRNTGKHGDNDTHTGTHTNRHTHTNRRHKTKVHPLPLISPRSSPVYLWDWIRWSPSNRENRSLEAGSPHRSFPGDSWSGSRRRRSCCSERRSRSDFRVLFGWGLDRTRLIWRVRCSLDCPSQCSRDDWRGKKATASEANPSKSINQSVYSILFYSTLFYSILFYSILFSSILFYWLIDQSEITVPSGHNSIWLRSDTSPNVALPMSKSFVRGHFLKGLQLNNTLEKRRLSWP